MKNKFGFKKSVATMTAVALFAVAGVFGASAVTAWATGVVNTEDTINVRASASSESEVLDTLMPDKEVTIRETMEGSDGQSWYLIEYTSDGMTLSGYVRADLISTSGEEAVEEEVEIAEEAAENAEEDAEAAAEEAVTSEEAAEAARALEEDTQEPVATSDAGVSYVIASSIPAEAIPDGFQKTTVSYEGKDVAALVMNSAEVYLLYMEDTSNIAPGRLVVYDLAKSELIPYICFETDDGFILLLNIPDAELTTVSDRFELTTCTFDSGSMDALQMTQKDSVISESANLTEFYYMYGVNRDGMYGWYVYNSAEGTIQENVLSMHYNLSGTTVAGEEERSGFSLRSLPTVVIVGVIVIFLLLVILVVIFGLRYRQLANEVEQMEERRASRSRSSGSSGSGGSSRSSSSGRSSGRLSSGSSSGRSSSGSSSASSVSQNTQSYGYLSDTDEDDTFASTTESLQNTQDMAGFDTTAPAPDVTPQDPDDSDDDLEFL